MMKTTPLPILDFTLEFIRAFVRGMISENAPAPRFAFARIQPQYPSRKEKP